jgi:hypothetical protein
VLSPVEDGPGNAARVLALKEKALALAILESEDFAVSSNVEFTLPPTSVPLNQRHRPQHSREAWPLTFPGYIRCPLNVSS